MESSDKKKDNTFETLVAIIAITVIIGVVIMFACFRVFTDWKWVVPVGLIIVGIFKGIQFIADWKNKK